MAALRVLLIQSSAEQRGEIRAELVARGFEVCDRTSGEDGLEALGVGNIDVIVCDLNMPGMSGMEVLRRVQAGHPDLPLIFVTAHPSVPLAVQAIQQGAYRFLTKPVNLDDLELTIHQAVEHARIHRWFRETDEQLRLLVESTPIPYIITRPSDGRILFVNRHMASLVGLSQQELMKRHTLDFYDDPKDRDELLRLLREQGSVQDHEVLVRRADGTPVWALFSLAKMELAGEPVILGGIYNITHRKEAEEALERERNFVSTILDTAGALVTVLDPDGRLVRFNRACEEITGYRFDEVRGTPFWDLLPPEEKPLVEERFERIRTGPYPVKGENHWITKSGERRLIDWSNTALIGEEGRVEYIVSIGIDITERRQAEERLRLYREIFMNSIDVISVLSPDGRVVERNPAHESRTGYRDEEVIGKSAVTFFGKDKAQEVLEALRTKGSYRGEALASYKDGTPVWVDLSVFPILDEKGQPTCYVGMGRDITEIKMALADLAFANQEIRDAQAQLVQTEKMASLGSLVAGIAHEINTPVGAVGSMHDTLVRSIQKLKHHLEANYPGVLDSDRELRSVFDLIQNANQVIDTGCSRVAEIVRRLRSFARLDEAELKRVDIHEGLEDTLALIHHQIKHHITVHKELGPIPRIPVYPGRLNQVFLNLLNNARQAITGKGEITIRTYLAHNKVHIAIQDTGVGIPKEHLKSIFDPGFTTKGVGVGTGLGLSICYQIIQEHKGDIRVESEPGKGSTFTVILPMNLDELDAAS